MKNLLELQIRLERLEKANKELIDELLKPRARKAKGFENLKMRHARNSYAQNALRIAKISQATLADLVQFYSDRTNCGCSFNAAGLPLRVCSFHLIKKSSDD